MDNLTDTAVQTGEQPMPTQGEDPVHYHVLAWLQKSGVLSPKLMDHMQRQYEKGLSQYHTPLMTFNGRSALADRRQELIDALEYLEQEDQERQALETALYTIAVNYWMLHRAVETFVKETMVDSGEKGFVAGELRKHLYPSAMGEYFLQSAAWSAYKFQTGWMLQYRRQVSAGTREEWKRLLVGWGKLDEGDREQFEDVGRQFLNDLVNAIVARDPVVEGCGD